MEAIFDWPETGQRHSGRPVPAGTRPEFFGGSTPFVTPSDMDGRRTILETERTLSAEGIAAVQKVCEIENIDLERYAQ